MRIFISAGEPSGDLHGANLARSLQTFRPGVECVGLGGGQMAAARCDLLCSLPFEKEWYRERGVAAEYVGHPFFDELPRQQLAAEFIAGQQARPGPVVALLPGSRRHEVRHNLETLVGTAKVIQAAQPD